MPRVNLDYCLPLIVDPVDPHAAPGEDAPDREPVEMLPGSFPARGIPPAALERIADWWSNYRADLLQALRGLPLQALAARKLSPTPPNLALVYLLCARLIGAVPGPKLTFKTLAAAFHMTQFQIYEINAALASALLAFLRQSREPFPTNITLRHLRGYFPQLHWAGRAYKKGAAGVHVYFIPFAEKLDLTSQWEVAIALSQFSPRVSATIDVMPDAAAADCIRLTIIRK